MISNSFARTCRVHGGFHVSKKIAAEMSIVFIKVDSTAASRMLRSVMIRPKSVLDQAVGLRRVRQTGIVLHAGRYPLLVFLGSGQIGDDFLWPDFLSDAADENTFDSLGQDRSPSLTISNNPRSHVLSLRSETLCGFRVEAVESQGCLLSPLWLWVFIHFHHLLYSADP
jgi:hypothetical protein